ncbi:MAG: nascent polypeptide-associated complex protein [Methanomicrobia archaeon]|nr:nascent polypeptide-associated complex protein [Methanomicrobia archaeon]HDM22309.1 nascent polypeptide-associated complex protein [Methanomicrobia archaeon]
MIPNMNPKQMKKLMKRAGIKTKELPVNEIIFIFDDKKWEFADPQVTEIDMMGQKTFQVIGTYVEKEMGFPEEDIKLVAEKANVSEEEAEKALKETGGDIAEAILNLSKGD